MVLKIFMAEKKTQSKKVPKIAFFDVNDMEKGHIQENMKGFDAAYYPEELTVDTAKNAKDCTVISIFMYSKIDKKILKLLPNLKCIATRSTGFDHIDLKECSKKDISVCNVPVYGENTVAEHAFALILSLSRKIHESYERTVRGNFSLDGLQGFDLRGKTIGVLGTGHIGMHVIRIAKGFEMNVIAYDKFPNKKLEKRYGFKYKPFNYLLAHSDIITIHVPYNKFTHHLINRRNINEIKKGAILINTARGAIVETSALSDALIKGELGGAGLDVLEEEASIREEKELLDSRFSNEKLKTMLRNHILMKLDNVIITPHNAFNSIEALRRIEDTTCDNIKNFIKNRIKNKVN